MATINNKLLPFRDYNEHDVLNFFALDNTGVAGVLVSIVNFNPDSGDGYTNIANGFAFPGTNSVRYNTIARVTPTASGATKASTLGLQIKDVREYDENGEKLLYHPDEQERLNCVISGQSVPIARKGLFTVTSAEYGSSIPAVGYYVCPSNAGLGQMAFVPPGQIATGAIVTGQYQSNQIIGKCISTSGTHFGGYAVVLLDC